MRIRPVASGDLDDLYEVHVAVVRDGRGVVRAEPWSRETLDRRVGAYVDGEQAERGALLVMEVDGRVVGQLDLNRVPVPFCHHVASMGVEIHPDFQGRGLGRALMEAGLTWARENGVQRLELDVRADNERALGLYRSLGFEIEGTRRRFLKLPDGRYLDDHLMALLLA